MNLLEYLRTRLLPNTDELDLEVFRLARATNPTRYYAPAFAAERRAMTNMVKALDLHWWQFRQRREAVRAAVAELRKVRV